MDATKPGAHIVKTGSSLRRATTAMAVLAGLVVLSFVVPTHYKVTQQAVVMAESPEVIASDVGGVIKQVHVRTGQWVQPGDLVLTLENPEIIAELRVAEAARQQSRVRFGASRYSPGWRMAETQAYAAQEMELTEAAYQVASARAAKLQLRARIGGYVLTPDVEKLTGAYAIPSTPILRLGDTRHLRALIPLTENEAQLVSPGNKVRGRWLATAQSFETELDAVSSHPAQPSDIHYGMLAFFGGSVPSQIMQRDPRARPDFPVFIATAPMPNPGYSVQEGLRVRLAIEGERTTVGEKAWRWFMSLFNLKPSPVRR